MTSVLSSLLASPTASSMAELLLEPALDPPPGVVPVFSTRSPEQVWCTVAAVFCTVVPGTLFLIRMYTRLRILRKVDLTDYVTALGLIGFLSMIGIGKALFLEGAGVHQWNLYRWQLNNILYWIYIQNIIYCPTIFFIKLAILLQYIYLLAPNRTVNPFLSIGSRILIGLNLVYYTISACVSIWACSPREKMWNDLVPGTCLDNNMMIMITCIYNMLSDVIILILPARSVWKLRIPRKKRIGIVLLFGTGTLACITNAFIIMYLLRMAGNNADASYNMAWLGLMVVAEISLGLCVISLLSLPKFMEAKGKSWLASIAKPFSSFSDSMTSFQRSRFTSSRGSQDKSFGSEELGIASPGPMKSGQRLSEVELAHWEAPA